MATQDKKGKKTKNAKDRRLEEGWENKAQMGTWLKDFQDSKEKPGELTSSDVDLSLPPINCSIVIITYSKDPRMEMSLEM